MIQRLLFFVLMLLLNFDAKAFLVEAVPSSLSDTCVEINLKSGTRIVAKITKKTAEKVYFKKCDDLADSKEYFVLQEKIDKIKTISDDVKKAQSEKSSVRAERKQDEANKAKQTRIWVLLGVSLLSFLMMIGLARLQLAELVFASFLLLTISAVWGLIEVLTYRGSFEAKGLAIVIFIAMNTLLFLLLLFLIVVFLAFL